MSNRTLVELNHDCAPDLGSAEFQAALARYLRSADGESREALERFGARVITMRHHADSFYVPEGTDGFPPVYFTRDG